MKIIVVSDSHGNKALLDKIALIHRDADIFWHLGDFELPEYLIYPFSPVKGNCDYFVDCKERKDIEINGVKFHLEHGHKLNYQYLDVIINNTNCDVFLFGHLHKKINTKIANTFLLNPGSLTKPRDDNKGSYLVITFQNKEDLKFEFNFI